MAAAGGSDGSAAGFANVGGAAGLDGGAEAAFVIGTWLGFGAGLGLGLGAIFILAMSEVGFGGSLASL